MLRVTFCPRNSGHGCFRCAPIAASMAFERPKAINAAPARAAFLVSRGMGAARGRSRLAALRHRRSRRSRSSVRSSHERPFGKLTAIQQGEPRRLPQWQNIGGDRPNRTSVQTQSAFAAPRCASIATMLGRSTKAGSMAISNDERWRPIHLKFRRLSEPGVRTAGHQPTNQSDTTAKVRVSKALGGNLSSGRGYVCARRNLLGHLKVAPG